MKSIVLLLLMAGVLTRYLVVKITPEPIDISDDLNSKCETRDSCVEELKKKTLEKIATSTQENISDSERMRGFLNIPLSLALFDVHVKDNRSYVVIKDDSGKEIGERQNADLTCSFTSKDFTVTHNKFSGPVKRIRNDTNSISDVIKEYEGCIISLKEYRFGALSIPQDRSSSHHFYRVASLKFRPDFFTYVYIFLIVFPLEITLIEIIKKTISISRSGLKDYVVYKSKSPA